MTTPQTPINEILLELGNSFYQAGKKYGHHSTNVKELAFKEAKSAIYNLLESKAVNLVHPKYLDAGITRNPLYGQVVKAVPLDKIKEIFNVD